MGTLSTKTKGDDELCGERRPINDSVCGRPTTFSENRQSELVGAGGKDK